MPEEHQTNHIQAMRFRFRARRQSQLHDGSGIHPPTLNDLADGRSGTVLAIEGDKELVNCILSRGFSIGTQVTVLSNRGHGPIVVSVQGAHFALGRREADLIRVQPL